MSDHIKKAAERLLTGHYAPQDVIDVCRAATSNKSPIKHESPPPGAALIASGGAITCRDLRGIGNRAIVMVNVKAVVDGWPEDVDMTLQAAVGTPAGTIINRSRELDIYVAPHRSFQPV